MNESNKRFNIYDEYNADVKFFKLPKVFFTNKLYSELSNNSKISWCVMRDRLAISQKNKWFDDNGDIYFIYRNEDLAKILNVSEKTVQRIKKELQTSNLLEVQKQGLQQPDILYLNYPVVTREDIYSIDYMENSNDSKEKFLTPEDKSKQNKKITNIRYGNFSDKKEKSTREDKSSVQVKPHKNNFSTKEDKSSVQVKPHKNNFSTKEDKSSVLERSKVPSSNTKYNNLDTIDTIETDKASKELDNIAISVFLENHQNSFLSRQHLNKILLISGYDIIKAESLLKSFNIAKKNVEKEISYSIGLNLYGEDETVNDIIDTMLNQYIYRKKRNEIINEGAYSFTLFKDSIINIALKNIHEQKYNNNISEEKFDQICSILYNLNNGKQQSIIN